MSIVPADPSLAASQPVTTNLHGNAPLPVTTSLPPGVTRNMIFPEGRSRTQSTKPFPRPKPGEDYGVAVYGHLVSEGLRQLNTALHTHGVTLEHDDLAAILREYAYLKLGPMYSLEYQGSVDAKSRTLDVEHHVSGAARDALALWDPEFITRVRERASKGGQRSRRGPSITVGDLKRVEGLSAAEAAWVLGCSDRTIKRRRRDLREQDQSNDLNTYLLRLLEEYDD